MMETFEWIHSWLDHTDRHDHPRVLLIGDSICNGYEEFVRNRLKGEFYVDFLATSHSLDSDFYRAMVGGIAKASEYDLIHFNFGLHGFHMDKDAYRENYEKILAELMKSAPVEVATSTIVYEPGNAKLDERQTPAAMERNEVVLSLADKYHLPVDDLWAVSTKIPMADRSDDGIHYEDGGWEIFADAVADAIRKFFN